MSSRTVQDSEEQHCPRQPRPRASASLPFPSDVLSSDHLARLLPFQVVLLPPSRATWVAGVLRFGDEHVDDELVASMIAVGPAVEHPNGPERRFSRGLNGGGTDQLRVANHMQQRTRKDVVALDAESEWEVAKNAQCDERRTLELPHPLKTGRCGTSVVGYLSHYHARFARCLFCKAMRLKQTKQSSNGVVLPLKGNLRESDESYTEAFVKRFTGGNCFGQSKESYDQTKSANRISSFQTVSLSTKETCHLGECFNHR